MSASETLDAIFHALAHQSASIDEKIERLKSANRRLGHKQAAAVHDLRQITEPKLGAHWQGTKARSFQKKRDSAHDKMHAKLTTTIDDYQQRIEGKIRELRLKNEFLQTTRAMAHEASGLLYKGEKAADALEHKLSKIKGRLF
ncbi:DUF5082 domain-containing protein [Sporolactobacillus sp. CPB3-1]|uniref:DUF5082 domain-containing protein n=1 Tax=Sporolactobacillus mangiferae TaxID=2940498 RepID=A0ABT0MAE6_9BACL|nr:DUF5082 family protein [Sporolactobacillus mangiferae]MCL1631249.1 DUF5082 domain-containing protein [Sporolactobacillus mangiferae]